MLQSCHSGQFTVLDDFLQHVFLPVKLPALSCSSSISFFHAQFPARCHHQSTTNASDTSDPAPSVPFHHSSILASLVYTSLTREWMLVQELSVHDQLIVFCTLRCTLACIVVLGLALCQFGSSFHRDRVTCKKMHGTLPIKSSV